MSITLQVELPDALVEQARQQGLLAPEQIGDLLAVELRRRQVASGLQQTLAGIRTQPGRPMTPGEIEAEVKAVRAERRARETGR